MDKVIAACGIDCSKCEARIATITNDNEKRAEVAVKWSKEYNADLSAESINCQGCMEPGVKFAHCNECDYRICAIEKGLKNCAECNDYPCVKLVEFFVYVPKARENLEASRG